MRIRGKEKYSQWNTRNKEKKGLSGHRDTVSLKGCSSRLRVESGVQTRSLFRNLARLEISLLSAQAPSSLGFFTRSSFHIHGTPHDSMQDFRRPDYMSLATAGGRRKLHLEGIWTPPRQSAPTEPYTCQPVKVPVTFLTHVSGQLIHVVRFCDYRNIYSTNFPFFRKV